MSIPALLHGDLGQVAAASRAKHGEGLPKTKRRSVKHTICPRELVYNTMQRRIDTEFFSLKRTFSPPFCPWRDAIYPESWHNSANWSKQTFSDFAFHRDVMLWNWDFRVYQRVDGVWAWLKSFVTIVKSELPWTIVARGYNLWVTYSTRISMGKTCEI
jgi:hypothetical protein